MATLLRPPPTIKTDQSKRPYFTLHKHTNSVMAWETPSKMAVVAFKRRGDVNAMGSIIENHRTAMDEWPDFRDLSFISGPTKNKALEILDVYEWTDVDELKQFCAERYFDLILIDTITASFKIKGEIYSLEIPVQEHIPYLNSLLNENDAY
jgi:hypothetical protein